MRELILILIVGAASVTALFKPRAGLYAYIWFALMRPDILAWSAGVYPYSLVLAIATLVGSVRYVFSGAYTVIRNPFSRWLILLQLPIAASAAWAVVPRLSVEPFLLYERAILMALLIPVLIQTEPDLRNLLLVLALAIGLLGAKFGFYGLMHSDVRYSQGYGGLMSDNNSLALGVAMAVPICWYVRSTLSSWWARAFFLGLAVVNSVAVVLTYSRGGALSLTAVWLLIGWRSRHRVLNVCGLAAVGICAAVVVGPEYLDRLSTMLTPGEEASASSRIRNYGAAVELWQDYPFLGVGFGKENQVLLFPKYTERAGSRELVVHNTYLQLLVDSGIAALVIYLGLLIGAIIWLGVSLGRLPREAVRLRAYPMLIQTALVCFSIGGTFLSRVEFDLVYILLMCAGAWWTIDRTRREEELVSGGVLLAA